MLLSIKSIRYLIPIAVLLALSGCAAGPAPQADSFGASHTDLKLTNSTLRLYNHPDLGTNKGGRVEVKYDDGAELLIWEPPTLENETSRENLKTLKFINRNTDWAPILKYEDRFYGIGPLDGRDWMDSELWVMVDINGTKDAVKYQACRNDRIYSAPYSKTLMDVVDKVENDPTGAKSDPEVTKYLLTDDALIRRLPVCNWRHRIGLEAAYPPPQPPVKVRIVPASHSRLKYVEVKGDKGGVNVYIDEGQRRFDKFVFISPKGSATMRPVYEGNDCSTFERCEHFVFGPEKKPDRIDIRSLDGEPLIQSRIFEVDDTVAGTKVYDGCAGGRLYTGKNRKEIENEVKIALDNPAPPPVKGAPAFGAPATSESGDIVIPDAFCDWTSRRQQAQAMMKNAQPAPLNDYVPGAWR